MNVYGGESSRRGGPRLRRKHSNVQREGSSVKPEDPYLTIPEIDTNFHAHLVLWTIQK